MITAKVICDSISPANKRLTTFELRYPKFIHGEFMTHRVISRNAGSSRAIPVSKLIAEVRDDATRAGPVYWGAEQKGMQSGAELSATEPSVFGSEKSAREQAQWEWRLAALHAADHAEAMAAQGVHKSIVNRLLEPFSHINVVATATEWDNFFGLRLDKTAQPEMRTLAEAMWAARQASEPRLLNPGEWHLPYVEGNPISDWNMVNSAVQTAIRISVARCARVSYRSFETQKRSTVAEDLALYDKLLSAQPLHASPAEHQATPDDVNGPQEWTNDPLPGSWKNQPQHGNLVGWRQYRKMLPGESCAPLPEEYR